MIINFTQGRAKDPKTNITNMSAGWIEKINDLMRFNNTPLPVEVNYAAHAVVLSIRSYVRAKTGKPSRLQPRIKVLMVDIPDFMIASIDVELREWNFQPVYVCDGDFNDGLIETLPSEYTL